eukprot:52247-Hanusia_phi.AAC.1
MYGHESRSFISENISLFQFPAQRQLPYGCREVLRPARAPGPAARSHSASAGGAGPYGPAVRRPSTPTGPERL